MLNGPFQELRRDLKEGGAVFANGEISRGDAVFVQVRREEGGGQNLRVRRNNAGGNGTAAFWGIALHKPPHGP